MTAFQNDPLRERQGSGRAAAKERAGKRAGKRAVQPTADRSTGQRQRHDGLHIGESEGLQHCWCRCTRCWARVGHCICLACPCGGL